MKDILTAAVAAKIIGCREQKVRMRMRRKLWDLGRVYPPEKTGITIWTYEINRTKLEEFLGRSITEEEYQNAVSGAKKNRGR